MTGTLFRDRHQLEAALGFAATVHASPDVSTLHRRYIEAVQPISPTPDYGIYEFDGSCVPVSYLARNVPRGFVEDYESRERGQDPLFDYLRVHRAPVHEHLLFDTRSWARHSLAQMMSDWGFEHSLQGPLVVEGRLLGTVNFAKRPGSRPFNDHDLAVVRWICGHVSLALRYIVLLQRTELETQMLRTALETINVPVVITSAEGHVVKANRAAHSAVISHRQGLELQPAAARAVADNTRRLQTSRDRVSETPLAEGDSRRLEYVVRTAVSKTPSEYYFSTFLPALRSLIGHGSEAVVLSAREQAIAKLVAEGLHNEMIASRLLISVNTVKGHLKRMHRKLGLESRTQLAAWAERNLTHL